MVSKVNRVVAGNRIIEPDIEHILTLLLEGHVDRFFDRVHEDVVWTVMGSHVLSGTYHGRRAVRTGRFVPILNDLQAGAHLRLTALHWCGPTAVAEFQAEAGENCSKPCDTAYCWIMRMEAGRIVEVRAYIDPAVVFDLVQRGPR